MVPIGKTGAHDSSANGGVVCKICNKRAETACEVCGEGYCSANCQKLDWIYNNHRSVCRPMPKLIPLNEYQKKMETELRNIAAPASSKIRETELETIAAPTSSNITETELQNIAAPASSHIKETNAQPSNYIAPQPNDSDNRQQQKNNNFKGNQQRQQKYEAKSPQRRQHNEAKSPQQQHHYNPFKATPQTIRHDNQIKSPQQEQQQKEVKNGDVIVFITGFRCSNSCIVCYFRDKDTYYDLAKQINELSASARVFQGKPAMGDLVLVRDNHMMQRGRIINVYPNEKYACTLYDSGTVVNRQAHEFYEMPDEVVKMQHITFLVKLKGVHDHKMYDAARKFLNGFINKSYHANITANVAVLTETTNHTVSINEQIEEFFSTKNENNFHSEPQQKQQHNKRSNQNQTNSGRSSRSSQSIENLNKMNVKAPEPEQNPKPTTSAPRALTNAIMNPPFKCQKLQKHCGEFVGCITDNSNLKFGYIGCVPCGKLPSLLEVMEYMQNYKDTEKQAYQPQLGEYCLSIFPEDGTFYRAKIIEISDSSKYRVRFIDFTNECWVTSDAIRRYPDDLKVDCFTTLCTIQGLPDNLNKKQLNFLGGKLDFQCKLNIKDVVGYKDEVAILDCGEVLTWLDHEGLLD